MDFQQSFNEQAYLAIHPDVALFVAQGKYTSGYDEFIQEGQFVPGENVIFNGTSGTIRRGAPVLTLRLIENQIQPGLVLGFVLCIIKKLKNIYDC